MIFTNEAPIAVGLGVGGASPSVPEANQKEIVRKVLGILSEADATEQEFRSICSGISPGISIRQPSTQSCHGRPLEALIG